MNGLRGRVAVVTGAARGIGEAIANRLAAEGATVVVCDLDEAGARAASERIADAGGSSWHAGVDVGDAGAVARLAERVGEREGCCDVLVNNAGVVRDGAVHKLGDAEWDVVMDVIARGAFNTCRALAPLLRDDARPHHRKVVNISSVSGVYGRELSANYCTAKAGLIGLTKALAREWAPRRVNVNAIAPGYIGGTGLTEPVDDGRTAMREDYRRRVLDEIPIGRGGEPGDVAALTAFLASSDADYITGQVVEVHGGLEILRV